MEIILILIERIEDKFHINKEEYVYKYLKNQDSLLVV